MDKNTSQFNLRTIFLVLTIIASLVAMSPWQSNARNTAFRLHGDQTQLEQALINCFELEQGELNFPPELDQAEQLVHLLGGIGGAPMYYEFSESQLLDVDLDGHPECTAWDPDIPFVLDNGKVRWMNSTTGDILEFEEVAKLLPKGPSRVWDIHRQLHDPAVAIKVSATVFRSANSSLALGSGKFRSGIAIQICR